MQLDGHTEIGEKRNIGCKLAQGEFIAHWDDDDYSAPGRLEDQLQRLRESEKAVTGYYCMRFTDGSRWWLYRSHQWYGLGTSLFYRRDWWMNNRFLMTQVGEDNAFIEAAHAQRAYIGAEAGDLMYAVDHTSNSHPRDRSGSSWTEL